MKKAVKKTVSKQKAVQGLDAAAITSIAQVILAAEVMLCTGLLFGSLSETGGSRFYWAWALFFLGLSSLLGGIGDGFYKERVIFSRIMVKRLMWAAMGCVTLFTGMATVYEFFPVPWRIAGYAVLFVQFVALIVFISLKNNFRIVVINYLVVMGVLLVCDLVALAKGGGSVTLMCAIGIVFIAGFVRHLKIKVHPVLDGNGQYQLILMIAVLLMCAGGFYFSV